MPSQIPTRASRQTLVAVLDANPILGEAMCRHFSASAAFDRRDLVNLTWDGIDILTRLRPSIVVLDPAETPDGVDAFVAEMRALMPEMQLIAYSSDSSQDMARACMGQGFRAFLPKSADAAQMSAALTAVARGGVYVDRRFVASLLAEPDPPAPTAVDTLSPREIDILRRIALGASHKQIGLQLGLSHKTVDTYRARGMRKLGLSERGELVRFALAQDWIA